MLSLIRACLRELLTGDFDVLSVSDWELKTSCDDRASVSVWDSDEILCCSFCSRRAHRSLTSTFHYLLISKALEGQRNKGIPQAHREAFERR